MKLLDDFPDRVARVRAGDVRVADWWVLGTERTTWSLGVRDAETGSPHLPVSAATSVSARYKLVWSDGKLSRGNLERETWSRGLEAALEAARHEAYEDPDGAAVAPASEPPEVCLRHDSVEAILEGDLDAWARVLNLARDIVRDGGFRTWSGGLSAARGTVRVRTSRGLDAVAHGTSWSWHASLEGLWGDGHAARRVESPEDMAERIQRLARTVAWLNAPHPAPPAAKLPVLLHPHVVESFVYTTLCHNLNGARVAHGESHFPSDAFGSDRAVLREDLSLRLDPTEPYRWGSYRFTAEGVPARPVAFVEAGRLRSPILDLKYARRLGREPTPAPSGWDTLHLEGSERLGLDEAFQRMDPGVWVLSVLGIHTQDPTSGDFSLSAPQSLVVRGGTPRGRARVTLAGNLFEILRGEAFRLVDLPGETTPGLLCEASVSPA